MENDKGQPPTAKDWISTDKARMVIDVHVHLRAIRTGKELALQIDATGAPDTTLDTPIVTHASDSSLSGDVATGSRRWVIDGRSWVVIVGKGSVAKRRRSA